jgi:ubiquitin-protein ligase
MSGHLRERRIENEWKLLQRIASLNKGVVEILGRPRAPEDDVFQVVLHETCGIVQTRAATECVRSHTVDLRYTRFFPSVPIEASLGVPVFHPNVDPNHGFVCLWNRVSAASTILEALQRLQLIISWTVVNLESAHLMQPAAAQWYQDPFRQAALPLSFTKIGWPKDEDPPGRPPGTPRFRHRLEPIRIENK